MRLGDFGAGEMTYRQPVQRRGALLADRLALAAGERGEEIVEAGIIMVLPVELGAGAHQPSRCLEPVQLRRLDKGHVRRGEPVLVGHGLDRGDQRRRKRFVAQQQPRPGDGRERHRNLQLGIILPARLLPGIGPAMVEDIFALAVRFDIGRRDRPGGSRPSRRRGSAAAASPSAQSPTPIARGSTERHGRRTDWPRPRSASHSAEGIEATPSAMRAVIGWELTGAKIGTVRAKGEGVFGFRRYSGAARGVPSVGHSRTRRSRTG